MPSDFDIDSPALESAEGEAKEGQFDEVVSHLQGEEPIVPVEEEKVSPAAASETEKPEEDVKLRIISDMKGESRKGDEERGGVPRLDLSESALAGIVGNRRNAAATRKGPGKRERIEVESSESETTEARAGASDSKDEMTAAADKNVRDRIDAKVEEIHEEAAVSPAEKLRLEKEKQIIARIVARDIERFCASATRAREKERAGQR